MAGMRKQKQIDVADSNMANYGSKDHRELRKKAAEQEPAYVGAGERPGLEIWRVEKLAIKKWPKEEYGKFFQGDSYIVLSTKKHPDSNDLDYDVHFWLGSETSTDEMGVAAYKTVELDDLLGDEPKQHREVDGHESSEFLALFPGNLNVMKGGIETGFRHVEPDAYKARLLHVQKRGKRTVVSEVPCQRSSLHQDDVFVLDAGLTLYQFDGSASSGFERNKGAQIVASLKSERGEAQFKQIDANFWALLGGEGPINDAPKPAEPAPPAPTMHRISDASGEVAITKVADAPLHKSSLDTNDVFVVDSGSQIFVWVGRGASAGEKKAAMGRAMQYLAQSGRPATLAITRVLEGAENAPFNAVFA